MTNIQKYADILLNDKEFVDKVAGLINDVLEDNKIDTSDFFPLLLLFLEFMEKKKIFAQITQDDIVEVIKVLLYDILKKETKIHDKFLTYFDNDEQMQERLDKFLDGFIRLLFFQLPSSCTDLCCCSFLTRKKQ